MGIFKLEKKIPNSHHDKVSHFSDVMRKKNHGRFALKCQSLAINRYKNECSLNYTTIFRIYPIYTSNQI